jgi:hypothetical protein
MGTLDLDLKMTANPVPVLYPYLPTIFHPLVGWSRTANTGTYVLSVPKDIPVNDANAVRMDIMEIH